MVNIFFDEAEKKQIKELNRRITFDLSTIDMTPLAKVAALVAALEQEVTGISMLYDIVKKDDDAVNASMDKLIDKILGTSEDSGPNA